MRQRLTSAEYRNYRWTAPVALFGWASFVGWTRIHAYQHFFSDVVVGAAAGILAGEFFYSFSNQTTPGAEAVTPQMLMISIPF